MKEQGMCYNIVISSIIFHFILFYLVSSIPGGDN